MASTLAEFAAPNGFRRLSHLVLVTMPAIRRGWLSRSGRYYAWVIAVFYAGVLAFVRYQGAEGAALAVITLALSTISGAGGIVAIAAARDLEVEERALGVDRVAAARGVPEAFRAPARLLATALVIGVAVLLPSAFVTLVALVLSPTLRGAAVLAAALVLVVGYAAFFGAALGTIARWSALVSSRYARSIFSLVVFGPLLAERFLGKAASLPKLFAWMIARIGGLTAW